MADEKKPEKTTRVWVQTKHGKKMWRFGVHIGPDEAVPMDLTAAQLADLRTQCKPIAEGGVFQVFNADPTPKPEARPAAGGNGNGGAAR